MPVVPVYPVYPNQVGDNPTAKPDSIQLNFGQMLRAVQNYNPQVDAMTAARMINDRYRVVLDKRDWYGKKVKGQISVPQPYSGGTCSVVGGSNVITGIGTAWTPALVGQQFRINFQYPYQTITAVDTFGQKLTTDLPFAGPNTTSGYMILQAYWALDGNIKRMDWAVNQNMGWNMKVNALPVECVNTWDTWRTFLGWSTHFVTRAPSPAGQYQIEVWPSPFQQQVFPFEAWTQPPDMQLDTDSTVVGIRSDIVVRGAEADSLLFRPKTNPYYDSAIALEVSARKEAQFKEYVEDAMMRDNDMDQRDVTWDYGFGDENTTSGGYGSIYGQNHD